MTATLNARPTWTSDKGWSDGWIMPANIAALETEDYQNRGGEYPRSNVPDQITAYRGGDETNLVTMMFAFKNTDEKTGREWVKSYCERQGLKAVKIGSDQTGDYLDDWIEVRARIQIPNATMPPKAAKAALPPVVKASKEVGANEHRKVAKTLAIKNINDILRASGESLTFKSGSTTTNRMLAYNKNIYTIKPAYIGSMLPDAIEAFLLGRGLNHVALAQIKAVLKTLA